MKQIMKIKGIARKLGYGICLALLLAHFSCDSIHETLPECRLYVDFRYDYNMEFANVFAGRVDGLTYSYSIRTANSLCRKPDKVNVSRQVTTECCWIFLWANTGYPPGEA